MPGIKKSYGIICCRPGKDGVQILMVKKSTTYHFCEFVAGHYQKFNEIHMIKLFNNMTYHEKMDILSMKFHTMWYRIYMENPDKVYLQCNKSFWAASYFKKKNKFESTFLQDGGDKLRRLVACSANVDTPWEFPKGRKNNIREGDIETAVREFYEETGIDDNHFKLLWHINPYVSTYTDFGTTYQNIYYYAAAICKWDPIYKFYDKQQISEVSAVRWITKTGLQYMKLEEITYKRLLNSFRKIIKKYKNAHIDTRYIEKNLDEYKTISSTTKYKPDIADRFKINRIYIRDKNNEKNKKNKISSSTKNIICKLPSYLIK
jgi:8-oxo-dGTP pyrophosphatase MutT (NUDIX family)